MRQGYGPAMNHAFLLGDSIVDNARPIEPTARNGDRAAVAVARFVSTKSVSDDII
jgi:hypothetical protein